MNLRKQISYLKPSKSILLIGLSILSALIATSILQVSASTNPITQSYFTDEKVSLGSIVSLKADTSNRVKPATVSEANNIIGVAVNSSHSQIKLSADDESQVQVATSGVVQVLVSDINGEIKKGDHITSSPISGVGMKATRNVKVVGVAQADLTEEFGSRETVTHADDQEQEVLLGEVPVLVEVAYFYEEPERSIVPGAIQNIANAIAGKTAKPIPIIVSGIIFIVALIVVASILFSAIRNSIISVGRNPMSQSAVYRNVLQISALALVILSVAVVSIYLVLSRF